jgi:[NiFe] hydrogenase diaphorase moiety large subunit
MIASVRNSLTFAGVEPEASLKKALAKTAGELIDMVSASGLKGRGGAGFPTGFKWELAAAADSKEKYVVCNADEGEPGTFKDRVVLTDFAGLVFAGMTIAGYAIGAEKGILYLRGEYSYLRAALDDVLATRRAAGLLGANAAGKEGFDFDIELRMGSGAYVCGEETALIESLEGHRGEPRNRPPFPVDTGYLGQATIVHNVETMAWVSCIVEKGADWWKGTGTERSTGLKLFSVSGDCDAPGVYEFPLGISVAELLLEVGGERAKAVQVGGASGNCVPSSDFGRKIAFEDVSTGGSVIIFGRHRDMLAVAENFMEFFVEESCGQCTPCREGNAKLLEGIRMLEEGTCSSAYLRELVKLGETMQIASKCGLGQSSPNAFLSIRANFREEVMGRGTLSA